MELQITKVLPRKMKSSVGILCKYREGNVRMNIFGHLKNQVIFFTIFVDSNYYTFS